MLIRHLLYSALMVGAVTAACSDSSPERPESAFADASIPSWTVDAEPLFTLGGSDEREGYYFDGIRGAVVTGEHLVVADGGAREIRFYDLLGELVTTFGGVGEGPGEFQSIRGLSAVGDTAVAVWDQQLRRVTIVATDGSYLQTVEPILSSVRSPIPTFIGSTANGTLIFSDGLPDRELRAAATGERRDSIQILAQHPDGTETRMWTRGSETWLLNEGSSWGTSAVIFGRATFPTVAGNHFVLAWSDSLELARYTPDLTQVIASVLPWRTRSVSESQIEAVRQTLIAEAEEGAARRNATGMMLNGRLLGDAFLEFTSKRIASLPARTTQPALAAAHGDPSGNTWVAQYVQPDSPDRWWLVVDSTLSPIARLRAATNLTVLSVSRLGMVVLRTDDLDRDELAVFPIADAR